MTSRRALGDANERRLAAALAFRAGNTGSVSGRIGVAPGAQLKAGQQVLSSTDGRIYKSPMRENRIMRTR